MKLALYVHDFKLEIGHSNSLIELIRHLPDSVLQSIESIDVVSYTSAPLAELFPSYKGKTRFVRVPLAGLKPVLVKSIFYQAWTWCYHRLARSQETVRIGIGVCCLEVDYVSVQFIHRQWTRRGLELERGHWARRFYKKILFSYLEWCERTLFSRPGLKVFSPAEFLTSYLKQHHPRIVATTIYSGVNLSRFKLPEAEKQVILSDLQRTYPALEGLDVDRPIFLFAGAYERKGLVQALELVQSYGDKPQFVVIGSPSAGRAPSWPTNVQLHLVPFTREIPKFYALADAFVFPTMYEPFGLVLFEAMAMGLIVITRRGEVGASELLDGLPGVYFCDEERFTPPLITCLERSGKVEIRDTRLKQLGDVSWSKAGVELAAFLSGTKLTR